MSNGKTWIFAVLTIVCVVSPAAYAQSGGDSAESILGRIPVQHAGRVKPFVSYAREAVLFVTGKTSLRGKSATELVWLWMANPDRWLGEPVIPVKHPLLRDLFSDDLAENRISASMVLANMDFMSHARRADAKNQKSEPMTADEQEALQLHSKARLMHEIASSAQPGMVPHPEDPLATWLPPGAFFLDNGQQALSVLYPAEEAGYLVNNFKYVMGRIAEQGFPMAAPAAGLFAEALSDMLKTRGVFIDPGTTGLEVFYWKLRPFHLAWILYVMSAVVWLLRGRGRKGRKKRTYAAAGCFAAAFLLHTAGFVMRIIISGRPPVTNMYESVIWVSWGTVLFACVLWYFYRSNLIPNAAAVVAALGLMIGENMPAVLDQSLSPLVPVLRDNFWLTTHVLTITLGYGAFALNWGIAHALLYRLAWTPRRARAIKDLTNMLYRSLQIGVILLSSGTVLGGVWANYSWGRFWGWDPKETWALIAILCYLAVLHGRLAGWLSTFGTAFWCAVSFLSVIMAWYGVNFVLGAGLHSYGFGGGGLQYVSVIVAIDLAYLFLCGWRYRLAPAASGK